MTVSRKIWFGLMALCISVMAASMPASAQQQQQRPNIAGNAEPSLALLANAAEKAMPRLDETRKIERVGGVKKE